MVRWLRVAVLPVIMMACSFERGGLETLGPDVWSASLEGEAFAEGEPLEGCGWTCVPDAPKQGQLSVFCARDDSTVVVTARCLAEQEAINVTFLDGCKVRVACGSGGI